MKSYFCSQQERVAASVQAGEWPEACDPELRAHVAICETCRDVVLVAQALRQSLRSALPSPQLPPPGMLWWRAQVRRRNAALQSVTRPVAVAETIAVLVLLLALVVLAAWQHDQVFASLISVWGPLSSMAQAPGLLMAGLGTLALFGGFAVYLFKAKE